MDGLFAERTALLVNQAEAELVSGKTDILPGVTHRCEFMLNGTWIFFSNLNSIRDNESV